mgnify:FL=1
MLEVPAIVPALSVKCILEPHRRGYLCGGVSERHDRYIADGPLIHTIGLIDCIGRID